MKVLNFGSVLLKLCAQFCHKIRLKRDWKIYNTLGTWDKFCLVVNNKWTRLTAANPRNYWKFPNEKSYSVGG